MIKERAAAQRIMLYLNSTKRNGGKHDRDFGAVLKAHYCSKFISFMIKLLLKSTESIAH